MIYNCSSSLSPFGGTGAFADFVQN